MKSFRNNFFSKTGFMLIEVLIALALFGLSAVFLVDGAFVATRAIRVMKDTREMEQDLLWARQQILEDCSTYDDIEKGGEVLTLSLGEVTWEAEVDMVGVVDLFLVTLNISYDGDPNLGIEEGEWETRTFLYRPNWGSHRDFSDTRKLLFDENEEIIEGFMREE